MRILLFVIFVFNSFLFGLSNEVLADKYLMLAQKSVKEKNYEKAVESFEKIFALGVAVPDDIYYFYAKTLKNSGDIIKAYNTFTQYIEKTGRGSKHYKDALGYIVDMEDDVNAMKRAIRASALRGSIAAKKRKIAEEKKRREREQQRLKQIERQKKADIKKSKELNSQALEFLYEKNYSKAFYTFKESINLNNNNGPALCNIGYMYNNGLYVKKDLKRGLEYIKKSIQNDYCYNNLGYAYEFGKGTEVNYKEAIKWYKMAIKKFPNDNTRAYYHLGVMIAEGKGFVVDYEAAKKKFEIAKRNGDKDAAKYLEKINKLIEEEKKAYKIKLEEEKKLALLDELKVELDTYAKSKGYSSYPVDTYIDEKTMLMWEDQRPNKGCYDKQGFMCEYTFEEATKYCDNLNIDGLNDWRVPSFYELWTIMDFEKKKTINGIDKIRYKKFAKMNYKYNLHLSVKKEFYFVNYLGTFWSSSKYARSKYDKGFKKELRWTVSLDTFLTKDSNKHAVICVRSNR